MKKIFAWFKKFLLKYRDVENRKFGDKVRAHPHFATVTIVLAMVIGVISAISTMVDGRISLLGVVRFMVYLMVLQMAESVMVSDTIGTAFKRFGLLLGFTLASFVIGALTSVVLAAILAILAILLVIYVVLGSLSASVLSRKECGSSDSAEEEELTIKDEHGYERKLKDVGLGRYQDDKGDYWKSDGWNSVSRE